MSRESEVLDLLEDLLMKNESIVNVESGLKKSKIIHSAKFNIVKRTIQAYRGLFFRNTEGIDFFINLRQVINTFNKNFRVNKNIYDEYKALKIGNYLEFERESGDVFKVKSKKAIFEWFEYNEIFNDLKKTFDNIGYKNKSVTGDARLKKLTGFDSYRSAAQKYIVKVLEKQQNGTTVLATLRTGGGKSLLVQYVSKYKASGTTVVVLPTIALTIDQYNSTEKYFRDDERKVYAYYEGISKEERKQIFIDLKSGKVAILYISPEAILKGAFYNEILKSAQNGFIDRLIVDEAHLIVEWGEFFRTEFQFLAIFRKKLLDTTKGKLKTILLSATITEKSQKILKHIYSETGNFIEIRGDSLRDEIEFFQVSCNNDKERKEKIAEIVAISPLPLIIYVPFVEEAENYYEIITSIGIEKVEMFTGKTSSEERKDILKRWNSDEVDIIIGTSAFGMGVDKKEVRTIIHTFIPESLDRFYQEVGRSGRDGFRSYSLLFSAKEDKASIDYFTRNKVLSAQKIVDRWNALIKTPYEKVSGNEYWLAVDKIPEHLMDTIVGGMNSSWNEYVILFLYRSNIIDILEIKMEEDTRRRLIRIKIKNIEIMNDQEKLIFEIEKLRNLDREKINEGKNLIKEMIKDEKTCWAKRFSRIYEYTEEKCIGCPACRKKGSRERGEEDFFEVIEGKRIITKEFEEGNREIQLYLDSSNDINKKVKEIIKITNNEKINSLIADEEITKSIIYDKNLSEAYLYNYKEANNIEECLLRGIVGIVLSKENYEMNNKLYVKYKKQFEKKKIEKLIFISDEDVEIKSENRLIEKCIDKISYIRR